MSDSSLYPLPSDRHDLGRGLPSSLPNRGATLDLEASEMSKLTVVAGVLFGCLVAGACDRSDPSSSASRQESLVGPECAECTAVFRAAAEWFQDREELTSDDIVINLTHSVTVRSTQGVGWGIDGRLGCERLRGWDWVGLAGSLSQLPALNAGVIFDKSDG
jgi:hypothetical protein